MWFIVDGVYRVVSRVCQDGGSRKRKGTSQFEHLMLEVREIWSWRFRVLKVKG